MRHCEICLSPVRCLELEVGLVRETWYVGIVDIVGTTDDVVSGI